MKKRIFSLLLVLTMLVGMIPGFAINTAAATNAVMVEHNGEVTYYTDLQKAFDGFAPANNSYGGKYVVTLLADTTGIDKTLKYPTETLDVTLDLNGYTLTPAGSNAFVIKIIMKDATDKLVPNVFTIKDSSGNNSGKITGAKGSGVIFQGKNDVMYFEGGTITDNHGASKGGGIMMGATAKLIMTGGIITGNSVTGTTSANSGFGGGVLANYADILGGVITGNAAYQGTKSGGAKVAQTGRGGGLSTEVTRTSGYNVLAITDGVIFGNTAEEAGDDVMAQSNGMNAVKHSLTIGTTNWYIDGWNGTKAAAGGGETARYDAENPVPYTDGGFSNVNNKTIGLKYVAPVAALPEAPDSDNDFSGSGPFMFDCQDDINAGVFFYYFVPEYATASEVYEEGGEYFVDITWNVRAFWESVKSWWDGNEGCGEHSLVDETVGYEVFTVKWNAESDKWEYEEYVAYYITCASSVAPVLPEVPELPNKYGHNVTTSLVEVICDSDSDHDPMILDWQHQSTIVYPGAQPVWSDNLGTYTLKIRIDSVSVYYVWLNYDEEYNDIKHEIVDADQKVIEVDLKWDADKELWVTLDEKPIAVHVTCQTAPVAPTLTWLGRKSFQVQVRGDIDRDGVYGESSVTNGGVNELFATKVPADYYTISEVYGSRTEGFFVDVTFKITDGDIFFTNWIERCAPEGGYSYDWSRTPDEVTFSLVYTGDLTGTLYGDRNSDWVHAVTGEISGKVAEAYVVPTKPEAPKQANVTDKLVSIICDSDGDRHETVYGKWYPLGHCETTSEITWSDELSAWTIDVKIGSLYIMYVDQLEDANGGTIHELVDDITCVYTTLVWDPADKLWYPVEDVELHVTCRTAPLAPTYNKQLKSYQIKVWGEVDGTMTSTTLYIPEDGYTMSEVYGSREEGFFVDIIIELTDGDYFQSTWIEKKNPGYFYSYDSDKTPATITITLRYNGSLTGTLYGDRHAANTNYDWVLDTNGKTYGVVAEVYLKQVMETIRIVIYRNGNTTTPYTTVSLGKIAKGEVIDLSDYAISDYYTSASNYEFYGWYNDGAWNQYKAGKNPAPTETITVTGWTNIICMIYDSEEIVVKSVIDGDIANAEVLYTGTAIYGTSLIEWLEANVTVADITGYSYDKWYDLASGAKIADDATVDGSIEVYVAYTRNAYTITFNTNGGSDVAPITQTYGYAVSAPANPTKIGHTFTGWVRADGSAFSFSGYTMEAADFTLTATWQANKYDVLLIPNYGKINSGNITEYTYGIGAKLPTNITRPGYVFVGWYDNASFKGEAVTEITATDIGEKIFYAKWEIDMDKIPTIRAYDVYVSHSVKGGSVSVDKTFVPSGVTVTVTVEPELGYIFSGLSVTTVRGQDVKVRKVNDTTYKFTMPASDVVVDAAFEYVVVDTTCKGDKNCPMYSFKDLDTDMWYHDGIHYCLDNGLMQGYGNNIFAPEAETTRAMIVTILWRLEGSPKVDYKMTFEDVKDGEWYTEAIRWAASNGIVLGYDEETFGPDDTITREQLATILYRYEKMNGGGFSGLWMFRLDYADTENVSDWAYEAMCWMTMNKIVQGKNDNVLDPQGGATRAEAATMLYRYCTKDEK